MSLTGATRDASRSNQKAVLERVLERDSHIVIGALVSVCLASWLYILTGAGMDMPEMAPTTRDTMMNPAWSPAYFALMLAMWWVMMVAMMLPSAGPMVLLFATVNYLPKYRAKLSGQNIGHKIGVALAVA